MEWPRIAGAILRAGSGDAREFPLASRSLLAWTDRPERLGFVVRAIDILVQAGGSDLAAALVRTHQRRHGTAIGERIYRLLDSRAVAPVSRDSAWLDASGEWRDLDRYPWFQTLRLDAAASTLRRSTVRKTLVLERRNAREPYDRGAWLDALARFRYLSGDYRRARSLFARSAAEFHADPAVDSQRRAWEARGAIGIIDVAEGQLSRAESILSRAATNCRRLGNAFRAEGFRIHVAIVHEKRGEFAAADRLLNETLVSARSAPPGPTRSVTLAAALAARVHVALDENDTVRAATHLRRAKSFARGACSPSLGGHLLLADARLAGAEAVALLGDSERDALALARFRAAERSFQGWGDGLTSGLYRVSLYRGHYQLRRGRLKPAFTDALRCTELARHRGCLPAFAAGLLLKSQLLLQERSDQPGERFHREVLLAARSLRDPQLLFRVLANLYLYTWGMQRLDWTQRILEQLDRLRKPLGIDTFERLYDRYVTEPVFHRFLERDFGGRPLEIIG